MDRISNEQIRTDTNILLINLGARKTKLRTPSKYANKLFITNIIPNIVLIMNLKGGETWVDHTNDGIEVRTDRRA